MLRDENGCGQSETNGLPNNVSTTLSPLRVKEWESQLNRVSSLWIRDIGMIREGDGLPVKDYAFFGHEEEGSFSP